MWTLLSTIQFSRGERFIMHFTIVLEKVAKPQNFLLVEFFRTYNTGSTAVLNLAHTTSCFYCVASLTKLWLPNLSVVHWPYPPKKNLLLERKLPSSIPDDLCDQKCLKSTWCKTNRRCMVLASNFESVCV